jgi:hypothetical protein
MMRRGFFGALIGLLAAPFAAVAAVKDGPEFEIDWVDAANFRTPTKRVSVQWFKVVQKKGPQEPAGIAYWLGSPHGQIRYKLDDGPWGTQIGALPLHLGHGVSLKMCDGQPALVLSNDSTEVVYF